MGFKGKVQRAMIHKGVKLVEQQYENERMKGEVQREWHAHVWVAIWLKRQKQKERKNVWLPGYLLGCQDCFGPSLVSRTALSILGYLRLFFW